MARTEFIRVRVTPEEKKIITQKALSSYRMVSDYVRDSALEKEIMVFKGVDEIAKELRYQGNNLNQLTVMARQNRIDFVDFKPFMEVLERVWQALNSCLQRAG